MSFVPGDIAEVRDWIPCNISSAGRKPGTYNILVKTKTGVQEVPDIPGGGLRRARVDGGTASGVGQLLSSGDHAEVWGWSKCTIVGKGSMPGTYDVSVPSHVEQPRFNNAPIEHLRRIHNPHWLHMGDPAVPSRVPGQDGGICKNTGACSKILTDCVAKKTRIAKQNCGGLCDIVFVGDSILERLTGWLCFSNNPRFQESRQVFQDLVGSRHPKSLILAGSCDETPQTLYTLDSALPALKAPKLYFVMIGTNNIPKGGSASALRGIRAVVARLRAAHPTTPVLLHALLPRADDGSRRFRFQAHIDEVNKELAAFVAAERSSGAPLEFVDCTGTLSPYAQRTEDFDDIMLHPTPKGYRAWLTCVAPVLDRTLASTAQASANAEPA